MKKNLKKWQIIAVFAVIVGGISVFAFSSSEGLQGFMGVRFQNSNLKVSDKYSNLKPMTALKIPTTWYIYQQEIVSAVTSPVTSAVTSVVVSDVTSPGGTSRVASAVTTPVASAVTSGVVPIHAPKVDVKKLPKLTQSILESISAKEYKANFSKFEKQGKLDFEKNPKMFKLDIKEEMEMVKLYEDKNPKEFYFIENKDFVKLPLKEQMEISKEWSLKMQMK